MPLTIYTIYDKPTDFPDDYVVMKFIVDDNGKQSSENKLYLSGKNLKQIRRELHRHGLYNVGRFEGDDPDILESWI